MPAEIKRASTSIPSSTRREIHYTLNLYLLSPPCPVPSNLIIPWETLRPAIKQGYQGTQEFSMLLN